MGAIASRGVRTLNRSLIEALDVTEEVIEEVTRTELRELQRRELVYRGDRPYPALEGRNVVLVDDGLATGATMRAAVAALRLYHPNQIGIAVPVAPWSMWDEFRRDVDKFYSYRTPKPFQSVAQWYEDFTQTTDEEVRELLEDARARLSC
jgi:putative phosphoribosyl transferase